MDAPEDAGIYDVAFSYRDEWAPEVMDTTEYREVDIAVPESLQENDLEMIEEKDEAQLPQNRFRERPENFNIEQDPELEKLRALVQASESNVKQLESEISKFQWGQATMDQQITLLHTSVENTQQQITQVVQAQVEMQAAMKTQTESITAMLQAMQQQMATMAAKFDELTKAPADPP